jgi:lysophospholipase L1-like esterase
MTLPTTHHPTPMTTESSAWITVPIDRTLLKGALEIERTPRGVLPHRLPAWAREQCPEPRLALAEAQASGVRLAFLTRATDLELDVVPTRHGYAGFPPRPPGLYDLLVDGELVRQDSVAGGDVVTMDLTSAPLSRQTGAVGTLRFGGLPAHEKRVEIWLPHNEVTELVALRASARVDPLPDDARKVWVHHGSSISHGSNADHPTSIWPVVAARQADLALVNLGFGGSALLDPFMARVIRDQPADLISVKIGINLVNLDLMRLRAFGPAVHGFLDTIRDGHPATPLVVMSPLHCPIHEETPGPGAVDPAALAEGRMAFCATGAPDERRAGKLTLTVIRDALRHIVAQRARTDPHLRYVDGLTLYGERDYAELPLPDRLHPDGAGQRRIGERFAAWLLSGEAGTLG